MIDYFKCMNEIINNMTRARHRISCRTVNFQVQQILYGANLFELIE